MKWGPAQASLTAEPAGPGHGPLGMLTPPTPLQGHLHLVDPTARVWKHLPREAWADPPPAGAQAHPRPHRSTRPLWISVFIFSVMCSTLACRSE